ncbi:hypothetical protein J4471_02685 [Candidatus Woesearchaeota archaeon]|nr:hypothetical protein [Candidatus Woesearchaeota archaeon]
MGLETRYGIISDVHKDPLKVAKAIEKLKSVGIDKLILNGDIAENIGTMQGNMDFFAIVLDAVAKSNLETFIQPGSHESYIPYHSVLEYFKNKNGNIIDTLNEKIAESKDHDLVFLPGSDWTADGHFTFGNQNIPTGDYIITPQGLININDVDGKKSNLKDIELLHYENIYDLKKRIKDAGKTIVICHVPRRFSNVNDGIDMAFYAEKSDGSIIPGVVVERALRENYGYLTQDMMVVLARQNGLDLKRENRGNIDLERLYREIGITKGVSGHFHESAHRAIDSYGKRVEQGIFVDDLFWNSGHLDEGQIGILAVRDGKISYFNLNLDL